jgi:tetratricopeptide (TPR) repeat protein
LGVLHWRRQEWQKALEETGRAIALDRTFKQAYMIRAIARAQLGDIDGAYADNTAAIALDASYMVAYINRAEIQIHKGHHQEAIDDCSRAIALGPAAAELGYAHALRGQAQAKLGNTEEARRDFQKALEVAPDEKIAADGLASLGT